MATQPDEVSLPIWVLLCFQCRQRQWFRHMHLICDVQLHAGMCGQSNVPQEYKYSYFMSNSNSLGVELVNPLGSLPICCRVSANLCRQAHLAFPHHQSSQSIKSWLCSRFLCHIDRPISQIPPCIRQISHNAPFCNRNVHTCTFLLQIGALWDVGLVHCGICPKSLFTMNTQCAICCYIHMIFTIVHIL